MAYPFPESCRTRGENHTLSPGGTLAVAVAAGILILLLVMAGVMVFAGRIRRVIFQGLGRVIRFIIRRDFSPALRDFDTAMARGVALVSHRPAVLAVLLLLMAGDWGSTVISLWFCFDALGNPIAPGTLITGFSLGITAGFVSFVPGGLGVQEGSMAGLYSLLGVPIRTAILAAILFRIIYYFVPFLISLGFYRSLLQTPTPPSTPAQASLKTRQ